MKLSSLVLLGTLSTLAILTAAPANAFIFDWQFTNENGNAGSSSDIVGGTIEFIGSPVSTTASATDFQITSVTGLNSTSSPFFGDGGIELNTNLLTAGLDIQSNSADFDVSGNITDINMDIRSGTSPIDFERIRFLFPATGGSNGAFLFTNDGSFLQYRDDNASTLTFSEQIPTSVPFEVDATLGLLLVGGASGISHFKKRISRL